MCVDVCVFDCMSRCVAGFVCICCLSVDWQRKGGREGQLCVCVDLCACVRA